ncbi:uncharacterized protein ISCGN_025290 [Ixodes scapularis]
MGRPYRAVDFRDGLKDIVDMTNVVSIGQFQMSHIWMISLASMAATENMKRIGQLTVKGRKCLVLDANAKDIRVRPEQPATTSQKTHGPYLCHRRLGMILPWSKAVTATVLLHLRSWASETKVKSSKQVPFPRVKGTEWTQTLLWELVSVTSNERNWNRGPHTQGDIHPGGYGGRGRSPVYQPPPRSTHPNRFVDLEMTFGRSSSTLSSLVTNVLWHIDTTFGHLLQDLNIHKWLDLAELERMSQIVHAKEAPLTNSQSRIEYFSWHKRHHVIKFRSVVCANGIIYELDGRYQGRQHDAGVKAATLEADKNPQPGRSKLVEAPTFDRSTKTAEEERRDKINQEGG